MVTGLVVNKKLNISREQRRLMRRHALELSTAPPELRPDSVTFRGQLSWAAFVNPSLGTLLRQRAGLD
jgi:hypothetical protein